MIPIPEYTESEVHRFINIVLTLGILVITLYTINIFLNILINLHIVTRNFREYFGPRVYDRFTIDESSGV